MTADAEPVTRFPNDATSRAWRERVPEPLATFRCARGSKRCDRVAFIYDSPDGAVVVFFQHTPDRPASIHTDRDLPADFRPDGFKHFDAQEGRGLTRGRRDETGTAVMLEDDAHWSDVVEPGCRHHLGFLRITRRELMDAARTARTTGRHVAVSLPNGQAQR